MVKFVVPFVRSSISSKILITGILVLLISITTYAQETVRIMAYNICEYPNTEQYGDTTYRNPYFRTVISEADPDILTVEEMHSQTQANGFLTNVLNHYGNNYAMADFVSNGDDNNVLYYKTSKFSIISTPYIIDNTGHVTIRFKLYNINTRDTLVIYSIHLASGESNGTRLTQVQTIRESADSLSNSEYYIGLGDFNMYAGDEAEEPGGYIFNTSSGGYFIDPQDLDASDNWSDNSLTEYNTFASRTTSFGGGTTTPGSHPGMDERFDLILISQTVSDNGGISLKPETYTEMGNDGDRNHKSINTQPNTAVSSEVADALYWSSDHIPIYADFNFGSPSAGGIAFTQVGSADPDIIEFITLYDHMDLTKLKITDSEINSGGELVNGNGTYDLSNTPWKDVPGGTFVRLRSGLTNDDNLADRILVYNGSGSGDLPNLNSGANGDQLIAFTGSTTDPNFIAGITWGTDGWMAKSNSYAPGTISDIALGSANNYYFSGSVDGDADETRTELTNPSNWTSYGGTSFLDLTTSIGNGALPVELSFFTCALNGNNVQLRWKTETEVNNYGFEIERSNDNSIWTTINFVEGSGNSNSPKNYHYFDSDIGQSGNYYYRLKQIDNDGTYKYSDVITVEVGAPDKYTLSQNYPNPFNPETRINFSLPVKQFVSLKVYNTLGELVKELINEYKEAGSYSIVFNASDLASGIYIYRLETQNFVMNKKMTLIK